jgi:hypothetical protein
MSSSPDHAPSVTWRHSEHIRHTSRTSLWVRDQSNNLVASTTTSSNDKTITGKCHVVFAAVVPKAKFCQFKVGTHGAPDYTFAQMQGNNWHLDLSMGS